MKKLKARKTLLRALPMGLGGRGICSAVCVWGGGGGGGGGGGWWVCF
eukprot:COSAG04_NODE_12401_length_654_cov_1.374775_2_plen_46_part_01